MIMLPIFCSSAGISSLEGGSDLIIECVSRSAGYSIGQFMKRCSTGRGQAWQHKARMTSMSEDNEAIGLGSTRDRGENPASALGAGSDVGLKTDSRSVPSVSADRPAAPRELSVRAENVLKELAVELACEYPPQGRWLPSDQLLERLTFKDLSTARNCGPQTTAEIIDWAQAKGKTIQRSFHVGRSLSDMWQDIVEKFSTGEISKAEVAYALEKSVRRRNTRIPVALQRLLLQLVNSAE
jgi:hypothetical protein